MSPASNPALVSQRSMICGRGETYTVDIISDQDDVVTVCLYVGDGNEDTQVLQVDFAREDLLESLAGSLRDVALNRDINGPETHPARLVLRSVEFDGGAA